MALAIANLWKQKLGPGSSHQPGVENLSRQPSKRPVRGDPLFLGRRLQRPLRLPRALGIGATAATWPGSPTRLTTSCWRGRPTVRIPQNGPACLMPEAEAILQKEAPHRPHLPVHQCPAHQALAPGYPINNPEDVASQPSALPRQTPESEGSGHLTPPGTVPVQVPA